MKTDDLISALAADSEPVAAHAVGRRLALGLGIGAVVSIAIMLQWLGTRPDMMPAMHTAPFWMKLGYALSIALLGFGLVDRLARPGGEGGTLRLLLFLPSGLIVAMALYRLVEAAAGQRMAMILGSSSDVCVRNILALSLPIFIGLFWSLRALAPTRLTLAGAAAGVLAGALGTFIYAFHCTESAAPFVALWYTAGIAATGLLGALLGRLLLRW